MEGSSGTRIARETARAILIDDKERLLLFKRIRDGREPYWNAPGGGLEPTDASLEAALRRELAEELGAEVSAAVHVFLHSAPSKTAQGLAVHHYFLARLLTMDIAARCGPEFSDPAKGVYELQRICLRDDAGVGELAALDLHPPALKEFILTNREILLAEAAAAPPR
jgi:ADP-ribose pyrophosphatase YjhB (NUDIX family)